jgi:hypothetical protein
LIGINGARGEPLPLLRSTSVRVCRGARFDLDLLDALSPFELIDRLIQLSANHAERVMLKAGRGNANFLATAPRHGSSSLAGFEMGGGTQRRQPARRRRRAAGRRRGYASAASSPRAHRCAASPRRRRAPKRTDARWRRLGYDPSPLPKTRSRKVCVRAGDPGGQIVRMPMSVCVHRAIQAGKVAGADPCRRCVPRSSSCNEDCAQPGKAAAPSPLI